MKTLLVLSQTLEKSQKVLNFGHVRLNVKLDLNLRTAANVCLPCAAIRILFHAYCIIITVPFCICYHSCVPLIEAQVLNSRSTN